MTGYYVKKIFQNFNPSSIKNCISPEQGEITVPEAQFKTKKCEAAPPSEKILHIAFDNSPAFPCTIAIIVGPEPLIAVATQSG